MVTPIQDSIDRMSAATAVSRLGYAFGTGKPETTGNAEPYKIEKMKATSDGGVCLVCTPEQFAKAGYDICNGSRWCNNCGQDLGPAPAEPEYKDTHATEKSEARADAPKQSLRDKYATEAVKDRSGSVVPKNVQKKLHLGKATEQACGSYGATVVSNLTVKESKALGKLMEALKNTVKNIGGLDPPIYDHVKNRTTEIFVNGCKHTSICKHKQCDYIGFTKRPPAHFASSCLQFAVSELATKNVKVAGVSDMTVQNVNTNLINHPYLTFGTKTGSRIMCYAMVTKLASENPNEPCAIAQRPSDVQIDSAKAEKCQPYSEKGKGSTQTVEVRDSVDHLHNSLGFEQCLYKAAMTALTRPQIHQAFESNSEHPGAAKKHAYTLLLSLERERVGSSSKQPPRNYAKDMELAGICNVDAGEINALVQKMCSIMPNCVREMLKGARDTEDDSWY